MSNLDLAKLNDKNPAHWTDSGEPSLAAVKAIIGRVVSREEVRATGRMRGQAVRQKPVVNHTVEIAKKALLTQEAIKRLAAAKAVSREANSALAAAHSEVMRASPPLSSDEIYRAHLAALANHEPATPIEVKPASKLDAIMQSAPRRGGRDVTGNTRRVRGIR
ncbi:hypothetical protein [Bradyrhizobium canariense]|uniref:Uncharacterized protein n=1 Tax=Bradyrhizobium canariense TaxID=255045 RepID=A0A1X3GV66_9BRAD|nr:hypothetical protein [Bradyrhizobium canariense]OSI70869.1 hypothetical protein BSZ22_13200 [Bradyrhizobium canariense]OSI79710.1 hypothetical protein BSZ23_13720 [Bradyrhizobium canariense]OSI92327.1 hypothetical protein BSZ25_12705 [Bradyrhizobium canariense]OSI94049.1 hypothetical protein BSZ24_11460 [Bradyrhizobium canariense]OSJ01778.1 hypothetical protein BSZ18_38925 [Bradyrhizobium canariense]